MTSSMNTTSNKFMPIKILFGLLLVGVSLESSAFGSLFTSPQQREILNQQRSQGKMFSAEPKTSLAVVPAKAQQVFFNGYVIRKSGPNTAWANQQILSKVDKNQSQDGISVKLDDIKGTSVPVKISTLSSSTLLQPGQFLNKSTREITEGYRLKHSVPNLKKPDATTPSASTAKNLEPEETPEVMQSKVEQSKNDSAELE